MEDSGRLERGAFLRSGWPLCEPARAGGPESGATAECFPFRLARPAIDSIALFRNASIHCYIELSDNFGASTQSPRTHRDCVRPSLYCALLSFASKDHLSASRFGWARPGEDYAAADQPWLRPCAALQRKNRCWSMPGCTEPVVNHDRRGALPGCVRVRRLRPTGCGRP